MLRFLFIVAPAILWVSIKIDSCGLIVSLREYGVRWYEMDVTTL
jgi:hypothetical protein